MEGTHEKSFILLSLICGDGQEEGSVAQKGCLVQLSLLREDDPRVGGTSQRCFNLNNCLYSVEKNLGEGVVIRVVLV